MTVQNIDPVRIYNSAQTRLLVWRVLYPVYSLVIPLYPHVSPRITLYPALSPVFPFIPLYPPVSPCVPLYLPVSPVSPCIPEVYLELRILKTAAKVNERIAGFN